MWGHGRLGALALVASMLLAACNQASTPRAVVTVTPGPPKQSTISSCPPIPAKMDDRSTATGIVQSYYNAIDRRDYFRAYTYLFAPPQSPATPTPVPTNVPTPAPPPPLGQWLAGYQDTACALITSLGSETPVTSASAGYSGIGVGIVVPITFVAVGNDGTLTDYAGTYAVEYDPALGISISGFIALDFSQISAV